MAEPGALNVNFKTLDNQHSRLAVEIFLTAKSAKEDKSIVYFTA